MTHESQGTKGLLDGIFPVETATLTAVMVYYLFKEHWEHLIGYVDSLFFGVFVLLSGMILWHFGQETSSTTKERNYG